MDVGVNFAGKQYKGPGVVHGILAESASSVGAVISISNSMAEAVANQRLAVDHAALYCTAGVHPHAAKTIATGEDLGARLKPLLAGPKCVAVGECGLDYNRMFSPMEDQHRVFEAQITVARETGKPLYLHCRDAHEDFVAILRRHGYYHGIVHCFTGTAAQARELVDLGFYIGITGWLLDSRRNAALVTAVRDVIPLDRLMVETDAPWLSIAKGRHSHPRDVVAILQRVAELKGVDPRECAAATATNVRTLFGIHVGGTA